MSRSKPSLSSRKSTRLRREARNGGCQTPAASAPDVCDTETAAMLNRVRALGREDHTPRVLAERIYALSRVCAPELERLQEAMRCAPSIEDACVASTALNEFNLGWVRAVDETLAHMALSDEDGEDETDKADAVAVRTMCRNGLALFDSRGAQLLRTLLDAALGHAAAENEATEDDAMSALNARLH